MATDIPFVKNQGNQCGQASVLMILKYFYPEKEITFKQINQIIRAKPNKYTFPLQNAIALDHFGLKAKAFSKEDCFTGKKGIAQFKKWFGKDFDYLFNKWIDYPVYEWAIKTGKKKKLFEAKLSPFKEIERIFKKGHIIMIVIDWNILNKIKNKPYEGHFVVITGIEKNHVYINDPDEGKNLKFPKKLFIQAYNAPEIADDVCVVYGGKIEKRQI